MIRLVIALAVALGLSLVGNGVALYRSGAASAKAAAELRAARDAGAIAALAGRADQINRVSVAADADSRALLIELGGMVDRGRERVVEYRKVTQALPPLPSVCGPGQARVDAVNRLTGATP